MAGNSTKTRGLSMNASTHALSGDPFIRVKRRPLTRSELHWLKGLVLGSFIVLSLAFLYRLSTQPFALAPTFTVVNAPPEYALKLYTVSGEYRSPSGKIEWEYYTSPSNRCPYAIGSSVLVSACQSMTALGVPYRALYAGTNGERYSVYGTVKTENDKCPDFNKRNPIDTQLSCEVNPSK